ncbi:MAG: MerR family DNA-binding transcriptional regulator [Gammaproteobacteria bacterium]|jgi:DNA-binding transcriptional MerR regulator|nr:MerR family DNA-binding transcriptional regulator [Gammaproteobacteria bacterium]MCP4880947.1 MerR family DNA-binding transcriptional regulator [Gammaproteobacteria bacterium]MDP6165351.1 MerR family DNA-binding transcriptional regulator [Gammaproteobacteria bacterium]
MPEPIFTIGQLSNEFDITARSIRFYEDKQLLDPRREGQKRIYSKQDRTRLKLILRGKRLGLSLDEIRQIIDLYDPAATNNDQQLMVLLNKIKQRQMILEQQLQDINDMQKELHEAALRCRGALTDKTLIME